ncbi:heavy-metal-associated domain-containing protein [Lactococcus garvieae]|jgi:copper chaperone|uniref:heavy-metal-associated domain-containing protein n=1 Tax=Lactococcus garvieae TaxID=1363 RepID=UPI0009BCC7AF|nr:heavy-metal-associated domain-containing protein [Lactococcus garvieae]
MKKAVLTLETLACPTCVQKIEKAVTRIEGVDKDSVTVMFNAHKLKAKFDSEKVTLNDIGKAVESLGYRVEKAVEKLL